MSENTFISELIENQKAKETLDQIKEIVHHDETIDLLERIKFLQDNTKADSISKVLERIEKMESIVDRAYGEFDDVTCDINSAISNLESASCELDGLSDITKKLEDWKEEISKLNDTPNTTSDTPTTDGDNISTTYNQQQ